MSTTADRPAQYVSFFLAGEEYAVSILRAREIVEYATLTRVPMAPAGVRGVLNLRGRVIPVIDLACRLGVGSTEPTRSTCILMVEISFHGEQTLMGVMIDAVSEVVDLAPADMDPAPSFGAKVRLDYLAGIAKVGKKIVFVLDIDRILSPEELISATSLRGEGADPHDEGAARVPASDLHEAPLLGQPIRDAAPPSEEGSRA
jgi:purine-binding chemotaxis protein CheW